MTEYTLEAQVAAVRREIAMRERAYPRWVANARMKPEKAVLELGAMRAVLKTLESLQEPEKAQGASRAVDRAAAEGWRGSGNIRA